MLTTTTYTIQADGPFGHVFRVVEGDTEAFNQLLGNQGFRLFKMLAEDKVSYSGELVHRIPNYQLNGVRELLAFNGWTVTK